MKTIGMSFLVVAATLIVLIADRIVGGSSDPTIVLLLVWMIVSDIYHRLDAE